MLDGVNKLCEKCTQECKQWQQVVVVRWPKFESAVSKHKESGR
jgi:hypothetical protein